MGNIPNRVRDMMGILVDVNLKEKDGKQYLEIVTEAYPYPSVSVASITSGAVRPTKN